MLGKIISALFATTLLWSNNLCAQDRGDVLLVASTDSSEQSLEMIAAIEGQLSDLPVSLDTLWIPRALATWASDAKELDVVLDGKKPLLLIWWDPESPTEFFVSVQSKIGRAVIRREISATERVAGFESMGLVVHELVDALLNEPEDMQLETVVEDKPEAVVEDKPEAVVEETETDEPVQAVTEDASNVITWGPSVAYSLRTFSDKISLFHGVNIGFELFFPKGFRAGIGYIYNFPQLAKFDSFDLHVSSYEFLLRTGYDRPFGKFRLGAGLALSAVFLNQTTTGNLENTNNYSRSNTTPIFSFIPTIYAGFKPKEPVYIFIDAGLFIDLRQVDYMAQQSGENTIVESSKRFGPSIKIGTALYF